ncbi:uncharacterized protein J8A68_002528 [[Candida] subhashii]|uniref:Alcohol acetyltransferase n=1 Tax=[Candida] subhashii TaxID=561895 RepID=A0A8J5QRI8_9ASCO|nr:uncharacterized protein J8A68_002528 [[Candida] subhashii]KAG7663967.1 hypothetical protein J8A68_002528 [[Candida] subhashii]
MSIDLRSPTFFERYQIHRTVNKYYSNFNVTAEYNQQITPELLSNALHNLIIKNPILGCNFFRINNEDETQDANNFRLRPIDEIKFDDIVEYTDFEVDSEYLTYLNSIRFEVDTEKPLWKLVVSQGGNKTKISVVCNHTFFDGGSGSYFHTDLVKELNQLSDVHDKKDVIFVNDELIPEQVPAPVDSLTSLYNPPFVFKIATMLNLFLVPTWLKNLYRRWVYPNTYKYPLFKFKPIEVGSPTNYRILHLSNEKSQSILKFTKSQGLTFTPYLTGIALKAFQDTITPHISKGPCSMNVIIDTSGRRYYPDLEPLLKYQGCVAASDITVEPIITPTNTFSSLKNIMNYISGIMNKDIKSRSIFHYVGLLKSVNISQLFKKKIGSHGRATIEVSNLGCIRDIEGDIKIENMWFSQDNGFSAHIQFSIVSTPKGGMNIVCGNLNEVEEIINPDTGTKIIDEFIKTLNDRLIQYTQSS